VSVEVDLLDGLSRLGLFADFGRPQLEALVAAAEDVHYPEGIFVVRRGDTDVGLHIIVDGEVSVVRDDVELAVLPRGGFFGEISTMLEEPAVADVVSRSPLRCLVLRSGVVDELLLANPRLMLHMLKTEARRLSGRDDSRT
jgi:CRP-like cAMP-binding protein